MSVGHFIVKSKFNLHDLKEGEKISESDFFTHDAEGHAIQLTYVPADENGEEYIVKPGIFKITKTPLGLNLEHTSFVKDEILEELTSTQEIEEIIDTFFDNIHLYKEFGIEIAKRNVLVYGDPGTGKSTQLSRTAKKYSSDGKTIVVVWDTARFEAYEVKQFIQGCRLAHKNNEPLAFM